MKVVMSGDAAELDYEPDVRFSAVPIWEIAIQQALGKISAPADLPERDRERGVRALPVGYAHAIAPAACR